jgi:hypothetical protein
MHAHRRNAPDARYKDAVMDDKKIRAKYGGKLAKAINRAIRAEIPGGNEALDTLTQLAGAARHSLWVDRDGNDTPEAAAYYRHKRTVIDRMDAQVRKNWGVPPDMGKDAPPDKLRRSSNAARGKPARRDKPRREGTSARRRNQGPR